MYSMTEEEHGAQLQNVYKFFWSVATAFAKSADAILHFYILKHCSNATGDFKN
jgi:hypothetical protein